MGVLETELERALLDLELAEPDRAAAELARTYARAIDSGDDLARLGPALLATLTALGMTPAARAALSKGGPAGEPPASPLDQLRARRDARKNPAAAVDPAAS